MKLGIDLGNGYVKFKDKKFASRVKVGRLATFGERRSDVFEVVYDGVFYTVGEGQVFTTDERYFTDDYKICLLTAIAESTNEDVIEAEICVGMPVSSFMSNKRGEVEKYLNNLGVQKIILNGVEKIINIKKAIVFVEGAYVIESKDKENVITIDIGAGTVNIIQWENQVPVEFDTKYKSFYNLYSKIAKHLKDTNRGVVSPAYIEENLGAESIIINQTNVDIKDTHKIIEKHIIELASEINGYFNVSQASKIQILGGGAFPTFKYWKNIYKDGCELIADSQFVNSKIYEKVIANEQ
ncbi:TPA: ParM/StbA family protein [Clostridium perfringens]|uniref:Actin-like protein N-terminal domain-containing protein n=1 Tax=Clostridium perfringens TaxID=1502 RepID=A0A133N832_CLOPF|nr:ParM/StbA family protein [Clostridium perfringens]EHR1329442.1 ParM/StbA family protein [Clostridium perfringens]EHR1332676.1 ParM/StbA family protein [Clostridium perfringens]EHR1426226.1 ParM/StbA family protein [Clostridium perfringens]ELC8333307.1 ParM/StbA family protein [Clostridium perfringens]ELC8371398.1 ParM/StbA family protein [Clostridium perfringens]